jgi:hypothetical protein
MNFCMLFVIFLTRQSYATFFKMAESENECSSYLLCKRKFSVSDNDAQTSVFFMDSRELYIS